ncbi:protein kinase domain-containing protein [Pseudoscourfieldia marina]
MGCAASSNANLVLDAIQQQKTNASTPSTVVDGIEEACKWSFFISHRQKETALYAEKLCSSLGGHSNVWLDVNMPDKSLKGMEEGVKLSQSFVAIISDTYFESEYCCKEMTWALKYNKPITLCHPLDINVGAALKHANCPKEVRAIDSIPLYRGDADMWESKVKRIQEVALRPTPQLVTTLTTPPAAQPQLAKPARGPAVHSIPISEEFIISGDNVLLTDEKLGEGGFAVVLKGKYHGTAVAVKKMLSLDKMNLAVVKREAKMLFQLRHPNVMQCYGLVQNDPVHLLVVELCLRGSLFDVLHSEAGKKELGIDSMIAITKGIANGMTYLHSKKIIHGDLKSLNVLMTSNMQPKLADFGSSHATRTTIATSATDVSRLSMSPCWAAPELFDYGAGKTEASDVYAYAITCWEVFTLSVPYENMDSTQIVAYVQSSRRPPLPNNITKEHRDLIDRCWAHDSSKRPKFSDIQAAIVETDGNDSGNFVVKKIQREKKETHDSASSDKGGSSDNAQNAAQANEEDKGDSSEDFEDREDILELLEDLEKLGVDDPAVVADCFERLRSYDDSEQVRFFHRRGTHIRAVQEMKKHSDSRDIHRYCIGYILNMSSEHPGIMRDAVDNGLIDCLMNSLEKFDDTEILRVTINMFVVACMRGRTGINCRLMHKAGFAEKIFEILRTFSSNMSIVVLCFRSLGAFAADNSDRSKYVADNFGDEFISAMNNALENNLDNKNLAEYAAWSCACMLRFSENLKAKALEAGIAELAERLHEKHPSLKDPGMLLERLGKTPLPRQSNANNEDESDVEEEEEASLAKLLGLGGAGKKGKELKRLLSDLARELQTRREPTRASQEDSDSEVEDRKASSKDYSEMEDCMEDIAAELNNKEHDKECDAELIANQLRKLMNLAAKPDIARKLALELDAFNSIIKRSMEACPEHIRLLDNAASCAHNVLLTGDDREQKQMCRTARNVDLHVILHTSVKRFMHGGTKEAGELVASLLTTITIMLRHLPAESFRRDVFNSNLAGDVKLCVENYPDHQKLQTRGCVIFGKLSADNEIRSAQLHELGVTEFVMGRLKRDIESDTAQTDVQNTIHFGLWVLRIMARNSQARREYLLEHGVESLSESAKARCPDDDDVLEEADKLLARLRGEEED